MNRSELDLIKKSQSEFYSSGACKDLHFRKKALMKLKQCLVSNENRMIDALKADLHKSAFETFAHELGFVLSEIDLHIRKLHKWAKPKRKRTPLKLWPSKSRIHAEPYGNVLIIAPWNYPVLLLFGPLVGAIAAGNTVVLKTSDYLRNFAELLEQMVNQTFDSNYIHALSGGREVNQMLFKSRWDYIFFTGSPALGKVVMKSAAEFLTPITLELGGKNPCVVNKDANLHVAARRIIWGKLINSGQTCIAPDYLFVHLSVKDELINLMRKAIHEFYGENVQESDDYGRIVNQEAFKRLCSYLNEGDIVIGGKSNIDDLYIEPTVIDNIELHFPIMQDEIFGPILPVITFDHIAEAVTYINDHEKPLAAYYFDTNLSLAKEFMSQISSGGACINDTVIQIANSNLPFGGVGNSGMGKYHGKASFDTFTNYRSMIVTSHWIELPFRYPPYSSFKDWLMRRLS